MIEKSRVDEKILVTLAFAGTFPHWNFCFRSQLLLLIVDIWESKCRTEPGLVGTCPGLPSSLEAMLAPSYRKRVYLLKQRRGIK